MIVSLYKNTYQGITLFSISVKILARVLESQCSFQANRGTADMIFVLRQLQKKCREQNMGLHAAFIDIMKAYDTVSRDGPWKILIKLGCMSKFLTVLSSCTKDRIQVKLSDLSDTFPIGNCVKHSRTCLTDDSIFNLCRLPAQTKTTEELTYCWQTTAHCWCTQK